MWKSLDLASSRTHFYLHLCNVSGLLYTTPLTTCTHTHARTHTHTHPMQTLHPDDIQTGPRQPCASQSHHVASNWCVLQTVLSPPTNNISDVLCKPQITALRTKLIPTDSRTALRGPRQLFQSHTQLRADARKNNMDPTRLSTQSLLVCSAC